ncbi:hypothetical protein [Phenylobacterium sp.]|uniref:tetratricopeptide repeat protein n=1 Tax=Phenylobacterium sp. TaxID=1871053 RepID=UPI0025D5F91D|nr:hypothetical protein [Phenylobacterium sp.]MBX3485807.1 hypothetical protein [Phenylobacterium sp.]
MGRALAATLAAAALPWLSSCAPQKAAAVAAPTPAPPTFARMLADYNAAVASGEAQTKARLSSALVPLELAGIYTERARLTGDYDDYARAEDLLARIEAELQPSDELCLAKARLHFALHRLARAKAVLDACPHVAGRPEDLALRADIAFYSGRYRDAGVIYRALANRTDTPQAFTQLALYSAKTGAPGEALAFFEAAEKRYHGTSPIQLSWYALQRGLVEMDRGRFDEARALFALADQRMPGYWLNEEHMAEITHLRGDDAAARRLYEAVVKKTPAPEYLDALAALETPQAAKPLLDRAEAIYDARARRFPEAIAGHALDHYLSAAPQPARALGLAEANFANRPYGDAAVALAKAYLLNGRAGDARRLLDRQLAQGWDTAEAWWTLSLAARAAGDPARAKAAADAALQRNAQSASQYAFAF